VSTGGKDPSIPAKQGECPKLATGDVTVLGQTVRLWVGNRQEGKKGPVFFYWHGTGSSPAEASLLGGALTEIQKEGGLVASFSSTTKMGQNTGNNVWYTGDFAMADQIVACAVEQLNIDTRRVYAGGCSAGGLQAGAMLYGRSSYLAAVMTNSGGTVFPSKLQDASHTPALITAHGKMGVDVVGVDFSTTSANETKDVVAKKGFAVNCDHGGTHCGAPPDLVAAQWQFLKAHPFGVSPEPYAASLPAEFPSYCTIVK
jgi:poly(3-hydroxybutyrate) depolymerase